MKRRKNEPRIIHSQYMHGGCRGQGQWARVDGDPITANPWSSPAARAEWEDGWRIEDAARKAEG